MRNVRLAGLVGLVGSIAGCGFGPGGGIEGPRGGAQADAGVIGSAPSPLCDTKDSAVRLCLTFDQVPMVQDLMEPPHHVVADTGVTVLRILTNTTAKLDSRSYIHFEENRDFDVADLTIDAWADPGKLPGGQSLGRIVDNDQQYSMSYGSDGKVVCAIGDQSVRSASNVASGWRHFACRYDAASHQLRVYLDGNVQGCLTVPAGIPTIGSNGLTIGASYAGSYQDHYVGGLDAMHVYGRALADSDICHAAALRSNDQCSYACPGGEGGSGESGDSGRGDGGRGGRG